MGRANRSRVRGGDDHGHVGAEPTSPAKYAVTCSACGGRFARGDPIAPVVLDKRTTYQHGSCRYPATAMLEQAISRTGAGAGGAGIAVEPALCRAITHKGKPCGNAPQKGEQLCGPHLTQLGSRTTLPVDPREL